MSASVEKQVLAAAQAGDSSPEPVEMQVTVSARIYHEPMILREQIGSGTLGGESTELAVNMLCGPLHDDGVFIVRVGQRWALLDNESLVRAVAEAPAPF